MICGGTELELTACFNANMQWTWSVKETILRIAETRFKTYRGGFTGGGRMRGCIPIGVYKCTRSTWLHVQNVHVKLQPKLTCQVYNTYSAFGGGIPEPPPRALPSPQAPVIPTHWQFVDRAMKTSILSHGMKKWFYWFIIVNDREILCWVVDVYFAVTDCKWTMCVVLCVRVQRRVMRAVAAAAAMSSQHIHNAAMMKRPLLMWNVYHCHVPTTPLQRH